MIKSDAKTWFDFNQTKLFSHLLIQAFLLVTITSLLALLLSFMNLTVGFNEKAPDVYYWVKEVYYLGKRPQMFFFMASIPTIFLVITGFKFFIADRLTLKLSSKPITFNVLLDFALFGAATSFVSYKVANKFSLLTARHNAIPLLLFQVIILLIIPVVFFYLNAQGKSLFSKIYEFSKSLTGLISIVTSMFLLQCFVYYPLASNSLPYINEYLNIPSKLTQQISGTTNSIDAINSIPQLGLYVRTITNPMDNIIRPNLPVLENYRDRADLFAQDNKNLYYYDFFLNSLVAMAPIPNLDATLLQKATGASLENIKLFIDRTDVREKLKSLKLREAERTNLESLRFNVHWQILSRWYFHHHNFVWGPAVKLGAKMNLKSIFFQYGIIGGAIQYGITKFLMGGFQIPNYFFLWSILYGIYFILFHIGVYSITKSKPLTIISSILFMAFLLSQQYEYIFLGPGLNPIRHFLDISAFVFAFRFFNTRSKSSFFGLIFFILLNFVLNPEFGFFCSAALIFSVLVYIWVNKIFDRYLLAIGTLTLFAHAALWVILKTGQEAAVGLYLGGFFSPVFPQKILFLSLLLMSYIVTSLLVRANSLKTMKPEGFILLAALLYIAEIFLYPLFGMSWNHIVNISPIIVFTTVLGVNYFLINYSKLTKSVLMGLLAISVLFFTSSIRTFFSTKANYQNELVKYQIERWQLKGNELLTQIPEKPILDSIHLIEKYSKKRDQLTMISRFDNLLPLLTNRATNLPGNELMAFLLSDAEYKKVIAAFADQKPDILFTDRDITMPSSDELIDSNTQVLGYLHQESRMRLDRVNRLKTIFSEIKSKYKKIDEGGVLAVWEKI